MSPFASTVRLLIQRNRPSPGLYICCCTAVVLTVPPDTLICTHCGCVGVAAVVQGPPLPAPQVLCTTQIDSAPPILRYTTRCITRSPSESSNLATPGCTTTSGSPFESTETLYAA